MASVAGSTTWRICRGEKCQTASQLLVARGQPESREHTVSLLAHLALVARQPHQRRISRQLHLPHHAHADLRQGRVAHSSMRAVSQGMVGQISGLKKR